MRLFEIYANGRILLRDDDGAGVYFDDVAQFTQYTGETLPTTTPMIYQPPDTFINTSEADGPFYDSHIANIESYRTMLDDPYYGLTPAEKTAKQNVEATQKIRIKYWAVLEALAAPYSKAEQQTWVTQEQEALAWLADNTAPCVMIRAMATARGISMVLMVEKIMENAALFREAAGSILGVQQKEIDELEAL